MSELRHQIIAAAQGLIDQIDELKRKQEALAGVVIMRGSAEEQTCRRRAAEMFQLDEKPCPHCAGRGFIPGFRR